MDKVWYPYAQHATMKLPWVVASAQGVELRLEDDSVLIDAISSWWSTIHGYNHPELNHALTDQLSRMAHVMLGGLTHQVAQRLAAKLVEMSKGKVAGFIFIINLFDLGGNKKLNEKSYFTKSLIEFPGH